MENEEILQALVSLRDKYDAYQQLMSRTFSDMLSELRASSAKTHNVCSDLCDTFTGVQDALSGISRRLQDLDEAGDSTLEMMVSDESSGDSELADFTDEAPMASQLSDLENDSEVLCETAFSVNGGAKEAVGDAAAESFVEVREVDVNELPGHPAPPLVSTAFNIAVCRSPAVDACVDQIGGDSDDDLFQSLSEDAVPVPEANSMQLATPMPLKFEPKQPLFLHERQSIVAMAWRTRIAFRQSLNVPSDGSPLLLLTPAWTMQVWEDNVWTLKLKDKAGEFERLVCDKMPQWQSSSFASSPGTMAIVEVCAWVGRSFRYVTNVPHAWITRATGFKGGTTTTVRWSMDHVRRVSDLSNEFSFVSVLPTIRTIFCSNLGNRTTSNLHLSPFPVFKA